MSILMRSLRRLRARPALTAARLTTVVILVAAVTAVLAVADLVLLQALPMRDASRLALVYQLPPGSTSVNDRNPFDRWAYRRYRETARAFDAIEGIESNDMAIADGDEPDSIRGGRASAGFLAMFGGTPALGRAFTEDEVRDEARLVVLSDGLWRRRYGARADILGQRVWIDRQPHTVIGVAPRGFNPAYTRTELWTPLHIAETTPVAFTSVQIFGRLATGQTQVTATLELQRIMADLQQESQALRGFTGHVADLQDAFFGRQRAAVWMLIAAVGILLLLAAANLANLTLADVLSRQGDFALLAALGGTRRHLVAPELVDAAVTCAVGATLGTGAALWLLPALTALTPEDGSLRTIAIGWRPVVVAAVAAMGMLAASVLVPVWRMTAPSARLTPGTRRASASRAAVIVRNVLVGAQAGLAVLLLAAGAVTVGALASAADERPGFDPAGVITAQLRLTQETYPTPEQRSAVIRDVLTRLRETPGIVAAGTTLNRFVVDGGMSTVVRFAERPHPDGSGDSVQFRRVSTGYLEAIRTPLLQGRTFDDRDTSGAPLVAIVSRSFAERFWPGERPVGKQFMRGTAPAPLTVVGVVDDVRDLGLGRDPVPTLYTPYYQGNSAGFPVGLVVRTAGDPSAMLPAIRRAVLAVDPAQPLSSVRTLAGFLDDTLGARRFRAALVGVFALIGAVLATIGLYGVTARTVSERTMEVGIRLALGGSARQVWWTLAASTGRPLAAGALVGALGAVAAGRVLASAVGATASTWPASTGAGLWLLAAGLAATLVAARRVFRVDPAITLRR